jgi:methyl-accepting chemotaxis protein
VLARVDDKDTSAADAAVNSAARTEVGGVLASSILLLGVAAWWLGRSITRPVIGGIARLKQNASQVSAVSMEVADASHRLSTGARDEAAAIELSSASMEEMSSMTRQNATHAEEAASLMSGARELVDDANVALGGMVDSMTAIQQATTGISKIIKTIDELAFQSNLLALNAAIEAARAGAAGAGFGVVADEVRTLAQRSAQAAKDTSTLIEASIARAKEGSGRVEDVVQAMRSITERLERLHGLLQQVKGASGEQTQGIDQVTQALAQMSQATQSNAAAAAESAATSEELTAVAHSALAVIANLERLINGITPPPPAPVGKPTKQAAARRSSTATRKPGPRPVRPGDRGRNTRAA